MASLNDMITRIVRELGGRTDLQADGSIQAAIMDAVTAYQKERFRWNELAPPTYFTFNTVAGQFAYGAADAPEIARLMKIDLLYTVIGNTRQTIDRDPNGPGGVMLALENNAEQTGFPSSYAYSGDSLIFYPSPDQAYPVTILGYLAVAAPSISTPDDPDNVWMNDGEILIRSRAKYEVAKHRTRNDALAQAMSPNPPNDNGGVTGAAYQAWRDLKAEAAKITSRGRVRSMSF